MIVFSAKTELLGLFFQLLRHLVKQTTPANDRD